MTDATPELIRGLRSDFAPYVVHFVNVCRRAGIPFIVISGTRAGPLADPDGNIALDSLHLQGVAFDGQVIGYLREELPGWFWQALGEYWERMGGRWGGRFRLPDVNHFDGGRSAAQPGSEVRV